MKTHSPSPWTFGLKEIIGDDRHFTTIAKPFDYKGDELEGNSPSIYAADGRCIAGDDYFFAFSTPEDIRLICAAPVLLEALEDIIRGVTDENQEAAERAIAMARGES